MLKALGPFCLKVEAFSEGEDGYGGGYKILFGETDYLYGFLGLGIPCNAYLPIVATRIRA